MNIRNAFLAAADHIESNPQEFDFHSCSVPDGPGCGSPGCAIGWIVHFMGEEFPRTKRGSWSSRAESRILGAPAYVFYDLMDHDGVTSNWIRDPAICAKALRMYADKHFPATKPAKPVQQPPNWSAMAAAQTVPADAVDEMVGPTFTLAELVAIDKQRVQGGVR